MQTYREHFYAILPELSTDYFFGAVFYFVELSTGGGRPDLSKGQAAPPLWITHFLIIQGTLSFMERAGKP